ncbi:RNA polymerase sigma-70 factor [Seonamhaeicola sp. NFXS20]|uniref:RNA polymerase sigma-70 factor n=1 Tax=Seonamhaeicola sp. NFXS20 TaxID=2816959 RepID=UPI003B8D6C87
MSKNKLHPISLEGYKTLFNTLYPPLCLFASKYLGDIEVSKDIVQEVFIKIWEKNPQFKSQYAIKGYFYNAVKNRCLDYLKSKHVKVLNEATPAHLLQIESEDYFLSQVTMVETYAQLYKAIKTLPKKMGKVMELTLNNYSTNEIAEELSVTASTVRSQKVAAIHTLRKTMKSLLLLFTTF